MKKYLIALAVALMVCLLGITASAETADEATTNEADTIAFEALRGQEYGTLSSAESEQMVKDAFVSEGWTIVDDSNISVQSDENGIDQEVLELAYMDIDKADSELKEKILEARKTVIYSYSWVNDVDVPGAISYSADPDTREVSFDPLFSELFPGWDVPRNQCDLSNVPVYTGEGENEDLDSSTSIIDDLVDGVGLARANTNPVIHSEYKYVPKATSSVASNFYGFPVEFEHSNQFHLWAAKFVTSGMTTINLGLSSDTGIELNHKLRTGVGSSQGVSYILPMASYNLPYNMVYGRASTYAQPGTAWLFLERKIDI